MAQLSAANWLFIAINVVGWAFSAGILVATVRFIRERLGEGAERMDKHEERLGNLDTRVTRLETEHHVFHHARASETPSA